MVRGAQVDGLSADARELVSPTFAAFVAPVGRSRRMVYAVVELPKGTYSTARRFPVQLGRMTLSDLRELGEGGVQEEVDIALSAIPGAEDSKIMGFVQLRPDRERAGQRFGSGRRRARDGSAKGKRAGRGTVRGKGRARKA